MNPDRQAERTRHARHAEEFGEIEPSWRRVLHSPTPPVEALGKRVADVDPSPRVGVVAAHCHARTRGARDALQVCAVSPGVWRALKFPARSVPDLDECSFRLAPARVDTVDTNRD